MDVGRLRSLVFWCLIVLTAFNAITAAGGGIAMVATDGLGMPDSFLASGPFRTFLWPGLILLIVVGGTQALAAVLLVARREAALLATAVAGFGLQIWIFGETIMIGGGSWLQLVYFGTGSLQLIFVLALIGIVGWLPRLPLRPSTSRS